LTWNVAGHEQAVDLLRRSIETGRVSHAYLLSGPRQVGKCTLALELAKALNCEAASPPCGSCRRCRLIERGLHPEVVVISVQPPHRVLRVEDVEAIQAEAALLPTDTERKVFVIREAELLHPDAAARLLKTLEEPPPSVVQVLTTSDPEAMLPTLVSRCQQVRLRPLGRERLADYLMSERGVASEHARLVASLADGCVGRALELAHDDALDARRRRLEDLWALSTAGRAERLRRARTLAERWSARPDEVRVSLQEWIGWWRDVLLVKRGLEGRVTNVDHVETARRQATALSVQTIVEAVTSARDTLEMLDENVHARLALDVAFLSIPRCNPADVARSA
jgi:DNA polymerase-3 subunit delta'